MTIERVGGAPLLLGGAGALAVWFIGVAMAALVLDPQTVVVLAPGSRALLAAAAADGLLVKSRSGLVVARAKRGGFVYRLYGNGAWIVLPAIRSGCGAVVAEDRRKNPAVF